MSTIVYLGNFGPSFSTESHVARDAEAEGHTVVRVQEARNCLPSLLAAIRKAGPDLVLYTKTSSIAPNDDDLSDVWDMLRGRGQVSASLHLDLFHGIARRDVKATRANALFSVDHVFTADGGHGDEWECEGVNHHWLPPAVVSDECYVGTPRHEYEGDVAFVGSSSGYHDEWPRRRNLVSALDCAYGGSVTRAGDGRTVREGDLNDLYASCSVSAGDSLAPDLEAARYWSDRLPEAAGRGSVLVHPPIDAARDRFGDHIVWCEDWSIVAQLEALDAVIAWSPEKRAAHIAEAVAFVKAEHSYRNRVATVLATVGL